MLNKKNRLAKDQDIKRTLAQGRGFFSPLFSLKFLQSAGPARFAIVVSTKISKKAVKRNRLKRILREFIRHKIGRLVMGDYMVIVRPKAAGQEESKILESLKELLEKLKFLKKE